MFRVYINLTTGLEALPFIKNPVFVRIQSSHIEAKAWDRLFAQLSADLLIHLAAGFRCYIVDASEDPRGSKVVRIGIPAIKYVLTRLWFGEECEDSDVRGIGMEYAREIYSKLEGPTKQYLRYFQRYLRTKKVELYGVGVRVPKERAPEFYRELFERYYLNENLFSLWGSENLPSDTTTSKYS